MKRFIRPLAVGMVALYVTLAVGAAGCLFIHAGQSPLTHHQKTNVAHSALCAWACQASPTASALADVPPKVVFEFLALVLLVGTSLNTRLVVRVPHSRAPPR